MTAHYSFNLVGEGYGTTRASRNALASVPVHARVGKGFGIFRAPGVICCTGALGVNSSTHQYAVNMLTNNYVRGSPRGVTYLQCSPGGHHRGRMTSHAPAAHLTHHAQLPISTLWNRLVARDAGGKLVGYSTGNTTVVHWRPESCAVSGGVAPLSGLR